MTSQTNRSLQWLRPALLALYVAAVHAGVTGGDALMSRNYFEAVTRDKTQLAKWIQNGLVRQATSPLQNVTVYYVKGRPVSSREVNPFVYGAPGTIVLFVGAALWGRFKGITPAFFLGLAIILPMASMVSDFVYNSYRGLAHSSVSLLGITLLFSMLFSLAAYVVNDRNRFARLLAAISTCSDRRLDRFQTAYDHAKSHLTGVLGLLLVLVLTFCWNITQFLQGEWAEFGFAPNAERAMLLFASWFTMGYLGLVAWPYADNLYDALAAIAKADDGVVDGLASSMNKSPK